MGKLDEFLLPELLRSPLEDSALTAKLSLLQMGSTENVSSFLAKAPDAPEKMAIDNSIQLLVELGAFTRQEQLTALGQHLTKSSLPPRLAKTVLWAILFGCLDDALCVIAAAGGFTRDPFRLQSLEREQAQQVKRDLAAPHNSDHACMLNAITGFTDATNQQAFCEKWHLSQPAMRQIRDNQNRIFTELTENKTDSFANRNRGNFELLVAVLCAGIFPNVARRRGTSDFLETAGGKVEARPHGNSAYVPENPDEWVFYQELSQMESTYKLKLVSPIGALPMLLLGGEGPLTIEHGGKGGNKCGKGGATTVSLLDGWLRFRTDPATAEQVAKLRLSLQSSFQAFCQRPGDIPDHASLARLDQMATLLSNAGSDASSNGAKRAASWDAEGQPPRQAPRPALAGKGGHMKGEGFKGKGFKGKGFKGGKW